MGPDREPPLAAYLRTYGLPRQAELVEQMAANGDRWRRYALHLRERLARAGNATKRLALTLHQVRQEGRDAATQWNDVYCDALRERNDAQAEVARLETENARLNATNHELMEAVEQARDLAQAQIAELEGQVAAWREMVSEHLSYCGPGGQDVEHTLGIKRTRDALRAALSANAGREEAAVIAASDRMYDTELAHTADMIGRTDMAAAVAAGREWKARQEWRSAVEALRAKREAQG